MNIGFSQQELLGLQGQKRNGSARPLDGSDRYLDLRDIFGILRRRARIITGAVAMALALAAAYILLVADQYTATSVVLIDPRETRVISTEDVLPGIGADAAAIESQVELIESTALAERIVDQLNLQDDTEFSSNMAWRSLIALFGSEKSSKLEKNKVVEKFREKLRVKRRGLTYVLEISFTSTDAEKAAQIANAVTTTYLTEQLGAKTDATTNASAWLSERIDALRVAVRESDQKVAQFKADNNIVEFIGGGNGSDLNQRQIDELNQQITLARARTAETRAKYERIKQFSGNDVDPGSLSDALASKVISDLRVQYATLASTEAEYSLIYGDNHPNMISVRSKLADMRKQIAQEVGRFLTSAKNEFDIAVSREAALEEDLKRLKRESAEANKVNVELQALEREARANKNLLEQFLERLKETSAQTTLQKADARIVSQALIPFQSNGPGALIVLLLALAGGLGIGSAGAVLAETLDKSFRLRSDLEATLSVPCFGLCPTIGPRELVTAARQSRLSAGGGGAVLSRYVTVRPESVFAEVMSATLWGIKSAMKDVKDGKVVLVSSALQNEGKTTLASNLALSAAKSGALVLLIDADTRAGSLTDQFVPGATFGLRDVLQNVVTLENAVSLDAETGLYMLPLSAKERQMRQPDILRDQQMKAFLSRHRDIFDLIVIDGPPVIPTADGRALFDHVDAAVFVVEWGRTGQDAVVAALNTLQSSRDKIAGTVLNKVDPESYRFYETDYT